MRIEFNTDLFKWSHRKPPSGRGTWAFGTKSNPDVLKPQECFFSYGKLYSEAKKEAIKWAADVHCHLIYVLP